MDLKLIKSKDIKDLKNALEKINSENKKLTEVWLNNKEAAQFLKMSVKTLYRYRIKNLVPYARRNKLIFFKKSDLIIFINKYYKVVNYNTEQ